MVVEAVPVEEDVIDEGPHGVAVVITLHKILADILRHGDYHIAVWFCSVVAVKPVHALIIGLSLIIDKVLEISL